MFERQTVCPRTHCGHDPGGAEPSSWRATLRRCVLVPLLLTACGASPSGACEHVASLTAKDRPGVNFDREGCEAFFQMRKDRLGSAAWTTVASCIRSAESLEGLDAC